MSATQERLPEAIGRRESPPSQWRVAAAALGTGFVISYFLYVLLRVLGSRWAISVLSPLVVALALVGIAVGALIRAWFEPKYVRRYETLAYGLVLVLSFCVAFNQHVCDTYLMPVRGFNLYTPARLGYHLGAEIAFAVLLPLAFVLPGYYFAESYEKATKPHRFYAAHIFGFLVGGPLGLLTVTQLGGPCTGIFIGVTVLLAFLVRRSPVQAAVIFAASLAIFLYSFQAPKLFFTWAQNDFKVIESKWTPYYKIDFLTFHDDHCLAVVHNNLFFAYVCDYVAAVHLQDREIFKEVARGKQTVAVLGGSIGTALSYFTTYQDNLKLAVNVEIDPLLLDRSVNAYAKYNGFALRRPDVLPLVAEARRFLAEDKRKYDLIFVDGLDNQILYSPLVPMSIDNHVFTREGLTAVFDALTPDGIITMDIGGSTPSIEYVQTYLASLPEDVHYELFWYVVPDRPMIGMGLFFIVASRNPQALRLAADHMKTLPSLVYLPNPPRNQERATTDDRPVVGGDKLSRLSVLLLAIWLIPAALRWRRSRRDGPAEQRGLPSFAFSLLGMVFMAAECLVVMRSSRLFLGPAYGVVLLGALFTAGGLVSNVAFDRLVGRSDKTLKRLAIPLCGVAIAALVATAWGDLTVPRAALLAALAGLGVGYFWPLLIHLNPAADRRRAYAADTLGGVMGALLFNTEFLAHGFTHVATLVAAALVLLLVWTLKSGGGAVVAPSRAAQ